MLVSFYNSTYCDNVPTALLNIISLQLSPVGSTPACEEEEGETTKFKILGTASVNDSHVDNFYSGIRLFFTFYLTKLAKILMLGFMFPDT